MTTITIPTLDLAGRPTRLESALWAGATAVQRAVAGRMLRRAERAVHRTAAARHAEGTRADVVAHIAHHPWA